MIWVYPTCLTIDCPDPPPPNLWDQLWGGTPQNGQGFPSAALQQICFRIFDKMPKCQKMSRVVPKYCLLQFVRSKTGQGGLLGSLRRWGVWARFCHRKDPAVRFLHRRFSPSFFFAKSPFFQRPKYGSFGSCHWDQHGPG